MKNNNPEYCFNRINDIKNFINSKITNCIEDYKEKSKHELIVLDIIECGDDEGFVFTNKSIIKKFMKTFNMNELNFMMDSTYKISYNEWILTNLGSNSIYFNKKKKKFCHKFLPLIFMVSNSETADIYKFKIDK